MKFQVDIPTILKTPARQFPLARRLKRKVHLHIGPTNSGKSFNALQAFKKAQSGYYAGPLRLLAREIYDRMESEKIPCNLITGDEILEKEGATLNSGTVEMIDLSTEIEVCVIDEIQMIADPTRGWAWTRALLGVRAKEVHLCGDPNSLGIVKRLVEETGDVLNVHNYKRLSPLEVMKQPLEPDIRNQTLKRLNRHLRPGDCVVCFSKRDVISVRDKIVQGHGGKPVCSVIYGSLPPETRAEQARLFNNRLNDVKYLVASDAIGMGLNLGIQRIVFSTLKKFDGTRMRELDTSEIKQIAGRAGRYKTSTGRKGEIGLVTSLKEKDRRKIKAALGKPTPEIQKAVIMPSNQLIRSTMFQMQASNDEKNTVDFSKVLKDVLSHNQIGDNYCQPTWEGSGEIAQLFDDVQNLSIEDRMVLANAPVPSALPQVKIYFKDMCKTIGDGLSYTVMELFPDLILPLSGHKVTGAQLEVLHKVLTLFLWLSYRFPCNFIDRQSATDFKKLCESRFAELLRSKKLSNERK